MATTVKQVNIHHIFKRKYLNMKHMSTYLAHIFGGVSKITIKFF